MNSFDRFCARFDGPALRIANGWERFCARFDGPALWLEKWWHGDAPASQPRAEPVLDAREERKRRNTQEAGKIQYRIKQSRTVRSHVQAILAGDRKAQIAAIFECIGGNIASTRAFNQAVRDGKVDPVAVFNEVTENEDRAKQRETPEYALKRLNAMQNEVSIEALLAIFDEYHDGRPPRTSQDEADSLLVKQQVLRFLIQMQKEFGDFGGPLKEAREKVRRVIPELPEEVRPKRPSLGARSYRPAVVVG